MQAGCTSVEKVRVAILENNGRIGVVRREAAAPPRKGQQ